MKVSLCDCCRYFLSRPVLLVFPTPFMYDLCVFGLFHSSRYADNNRKANGDLYFHIKNFTYCISSQSTYQSNTIFSKVSLKIVQQPNPSCDNISCCRHNAIVSFFILLYVSLRQSLYLHRSAFSDISSSLSRRCSYKAWGSI